MISAFLPILLKNMATNLINFIDWQNSASGYLFIAVHVQKCIFFCLCAIFKIRTYSLVQRFVYTFDAVWSQIYFIPHQKCIQIAGPNCSIKKRKSWFYPILKGLSSILQNWDFPFDRNLCICSLVSDFTFGILTFNHFLNTLKNFPCI